MLEVLFYFILLFVFLIIVTVLHEGLHIFILKRHGISYYLKWLKVGFFPVGLAVYSEHFDNTYKKLSKEKQKLYFRTAIFPYLFILPMCMFVTQLGNIYLFLTGEIILIAHLMNLPLEFFSVYDVKKNKKVV